MLGAGDGRHFPKVHSSEVELMDNWYGVDDEDPEDPQP